MLSLEQYRQMADQAISRLSLPAHPAGLYQPIRYMLDGGGKRIRPVLALASCEAVGADPMSAIHQAIAIEMFHNFTLLHDDIMDKSDMRHGRPTVHRKWNESTAILSGDAMLTTATMLLAIKAGDKLAPALDLFNGTAMNIYEGQQLDMDFEQRMDVTVEEYMEMIRLKTSVLLGCACGMGALMGNADFDTQIGFFNYGVNLGLAFQLQDDFLDTFGNPEVFGKAVGGDILNDKKTWLLIQALRDDHDGSLRDIIANPPAPEVKIEKVRAIYKSLGLADGIRELIRAYTDTAVATLDALPISPEARAFFLKFAYDTASRIK